MYILPKDLQEETNVLDVIPYVFDVDVIKDCSSLRNEIADVFSVISRDNGTGTYFTSIEKVCIEALVVQLNPEVLVISFSFVFPNLQFTRTANDLLKQYGLETNILDYIQNYL